MLVSDRSADHMAAGDVPGCGAKSASVGLHMAKSVAYSKPLDVHGCRVSV